MISIPELYSKYLNSGQITTDSRKVEKGDLFFALKGPRFNGNRYAEKALEGGAALAIVDEETFSKGDRYLLVDNVLSTLQNLAQYHGQQFDIPIIAITGSNGKTTTKELISAVLKHHYKTHVTQGNLNNHIGVPLTILAMQKETEIAVIEMGANHMNEITMLCEIARPTHGLITNIGKAHLEGFGSLEGVKKGKSELYDFLAAHHRVAFINKDEQFLIELSEAVKLRVFYHQSDHPDADNQEYETKLISTKPFLKVGFLDENEALTEVQSQLVGQYNFNNIMTAITLGKYFKVPGEKIKNAIEGYQPDNNRSQIFQNNSNTFFLDAYNANPTSMMAALDHFSKIQTRQTKMAILGDMFELGKHSEVEHRKILDYTKLLNIEKIIVVGEVFLHVVNDKSIRAFKDLNALKSWYESANINNHYIFLKGSRSMRLEALLG